MSWKTHRAYPVPIDRALAEWTVPTQRWLLKPWIPYGGITLLVAPAKTGKTTFVMDLLAARHHGVPFLGETIAPGSTLYVTEQNPAIFGTQARGSNLVGHGFPIDLMARYRFLDLNWYQFCEVMHERVVELRHNEVVIDTWAGVAGFAAEMENDSPEARARLEALGPIVAEGCAVILVAHQGHQREHASTPITAARGSTGLGDGVDVAIWLQKRTGSRPGSGQAGDPDGPGRSLWAEGRLVELPTMRVNIVRDGPMPIAIAKGLSGDQPLIGGPDTGQNIAKWRYENGLWLSAPSTNDQKCPDTRKTFTTQELMAIWGCSERTVRRRVATKIAAGEQVQRLVEPGKPLRYYFPDRDPQAS